jgi:Ribosomal protein L6e
LDAQKTVDTALLANIKASSEKLLGKYLAARFSLGNNDKAHEIHF